MLDRKVETRPLGLSPKDIKLVPEHDHLEIHGARALALSDQQPE
jgi:hypothetical protein